MLVLSFRNCILLYRCVALPDVHVDLTIFGCERLSRNLVAWLVRSLYDVYEYLNICINIFRFGILMLF